MSDLVQQTFGLRRAPFDKNLPAESLWLDDGREAAIDTLLDAVTHRRHALVTGEPGVGKTTVLRALNSRLSPVHYKSFYLPYVTLSPRDFTRQLCRALGLEVKAMPGAMFDALQREAHKLHNEHRVHPILVLDECHLMPGRTLSHLHILANFNWDSEPLMSLVLVGLPDLHEQLRLGIHRSLLTRLSVKVELQPATAERTSTYVRQRLTDAGAKADLFTPDGLGMLHELSGGLLRSVDVLASAALRIAAHQDVKLVDRQLVVRAYHTTPLA